MHDSRLDILYDRYYHQTATDEEVRELMEMLAGLDDSTLERLVDKAFASYSTTPEIEPAVSRAIRNAITRDGSADFEKPRSRLLILKWVRYAAAAILIIVAGALFYFHDRHPGDTMPLVAVAKPDVAPGTNTATLTLGDGSMIRMDSAYTGAVANQGNVQVIKLANGKLLYKAEKGRPLTVMNNTMSTPRGGKYQLVLPDGTQVWLNAASSITYPTAFLGKDRQVSITGEAYFDVAKDLGKPFRVSAGALRVEALGTHFNINAYPDEHSIRATLIEGAVKVQAGANRGLLTPGQQAQMDASQNLLIDQHADVELAIAWKNGYFEFNQTDLKTVMRQLSRWYDVEIEYQGKTPERKFWGEIPMDSNLSDVLKILQASAVHFNIEGKKIIVMP